MRNKRRSECLILCERRYWRPVRRPHPFSALVDSRISAIRLFNSCSVISLSTLNDPGDRIDSFPGPSLFCVIFPFGLLTALVQWYQLFHGNSPPIFSAVDIRPKAHGIHPNSLYSPATSSSSATLPGLPGTALDQVSAHGRRSHGTESHPVHIPRRNVPAPDA